MNPSFQPVYGTEYKFDTFTLCRLSGILSCATCARLENGHALFAPASIWSYNNSARSRYGHVRSFLSQSNSTMNKSCRLYIHLENCRVCESSPRTRKHLPSTDKGKNRHLAVFHFPLRKRLLQLGYHLFPSSLSQFLLLLDLAHNLPHNLSQYHENTHTASTTVICASSRPCHHSVQ